MGKSGLSFTNQVAATTLGTLDNQAPANLTWGALGKACLLDDGEFGLLGARLRLQGGW